MSSRGAARQPEFGILGAVEVRGGAGPVPLGSHRVRCVLAVLLVHVERTVDIDGLVDLLWERPPPTARTMVAGTICTLRRALRHLDDVDLLTVGQGYQLAADPMTVDWQRFQRLCADARRPISPLDARDRLAEALALWRGPALADARTPMIEQHVCPVLDAGRTAAWSEFAQREHRGAVEGEDPAHALGADGQHVPCVRL